MGGDGLAGEIGVAEGGLDEGVVVEALGLLVVAATGGAVVGADLGLKRREIQIIAFSIPTFMNCIAFLLTETMCEVSMWQWLLSTSSLTSPSSADTSCGEFWFMFEHVVSAPKAAHAPT